LYARLTATYDYFAKVFTTNNIDECNVSMTTFTGADYIIAHRLSSDTPRSLREQTQRNINGFSREGLRTLLLAQVFFEKKNSFSFFSKILIIL